MFWRIVFHLHSQTSVYSFSLLWKIGRISVHLGLWVDMVFTGWKNVIAILSWKENYKETFKLYVCHDDFPLHKIYIHKMIHGHINVQI